MLFRVAGKFADNFTFSINPVDAEGPREAMAAVLGEPSVKAAITTHGDVNTIVVKRLSGKNSRVRISDKPAAERKGGGRKKKGATAAASAPTTGRK